MPTKFLATAGLALASSGLGLINYVSPKIIGFTPEVNDWIAKYCAAAPKRLLAFGGVHPSAVPDPGAEVDRMARLGIRAIKIHPSHQALSPNGYVHGDGGLAAVYERAQANGLPVMIHTGTSIFPGARNLHAQPMLCDEIGVDYPELGGDSGAWRAAVVDGGSVFSGAAAQEYVHGYFGNSAAEIAGVFSADRADRGQSALGNGLAESRSARNSGQHREIQRAADTRRREAKNFVRKCGAVVSRLGRVVAQFLLQVSAE